MTLALSPRLKQRRASATLADIDAGGAGGAIEVYAGERPAPGEAPVGAKLGTIRLTYPAGTVDAAGLHITSVGPAQIQNSGIPAWARFVDSTGEWCIDCDVAETGPADIILTLEDGSVVDVVFSGSFFILVAADLAEGG